MNSDDPTKQNPPQAGTPASSDAPTLDQPPAPQTPPAERSETPQPHAPPKPETPPEAASVKTRGSAGGSTVPMPLIQQVRIPEILPILPVRGSVAFPGAVMPLAIGRPRSKRLLNEVLPGEKIIGIVTQKNENTEEPVAADLYQIGAAALVLKMLRMPEGHLNIVVHGIVRFRVEEILLRRAVHDRPRHRPPQRPPR